MMKNKTALVVSFHITLIVSVPITLAATQNLVYDANGNLVTGDSKYREYDGFNHLVRIRDGNNATGIVLENLTWHPIEERIVIKDVYQTNGSFVETIYYPTKEFVRVLNATESYDYNYVYKNGQLIAQHFIGEQKHFMLNDHKGSVQVVVNESGAKVEETFYSPFGEVISGGATSRFDYEGKEFDSVVGDYDYHARKYCPSTHTFCQPDTMLPNVYDPQQLNRYAFERNNPFKYTDDDGNIAVLAPAAIGFGIGVASYFAYHYFTDKQYTWEGALGSGVGGALAIAIVTVAPSLIGSSLTSAGSAGSVAGGVSQISANIGEGNPWYQNIFSAAVAGAISAGIGHEFLPLARTWLIKNPLSYLTTGTGQTYLSNTILENLASSSLSNTFQGGIINSGGNSYVSTSNGYSYTIPTSLYNQYPNANWGNKEQGKGLCLSCPNNAGENSGSSGGSSGSNSGTIDYGYTPTSPAWSRHYH